MKRLTIADQMVPGRTYRGTADGPDELNDLTFTPLVIVACNAEGGGVPNDSKDPGTLLQISYDAWAFPLPQTVFMSPGDVVLELDAPDDNTPPSFLRDLGIMEDYISYARRALHDEHEGNFKYYVNQLNAYAHHLALQVNDM